MLYVLVALIATGFISVALLKISTSDRISNVNYGTSATARSAAKSGIVYAIQQLEASGSANVDATLERLQAWVDSARTSDIPDNYVWFTTGTDHFQDMVGSSDLQFRTKILAFDHNEFTVTLQSEGIGNGGARATIVAVHHLDGLKIEAHPTVRPTNALHLGGGAGELDRALNVYGGMYIKGNGYCYGTDIPDRSNFYGQVYIDYRANKGFTIKNATFHEEVYFGGHSDSIQLVTDYSISPASASALTKTIFKKGIGVENRLYVGSHYIGSTGSNGPSIDVESGGIYANGAIFWNQNTSTKFDLMNNGVASLRQGKSYRSAGSNGGDKIIKNNTGSSIIYNTTDIDIPLALGIPKPPVIPIFLDDIRLKAQNFPSGNSVTGAQMNTYYDNFGDYYIDDADEKWAVYNYRGSGGTPFQSGGTGFKGKVIWLVESHNMAISTQFYEHDIVGAPTVDKPTLDKGLTVLYVGNNKKIEGMGGCDNFRGFIYSVTNKKNIYKAKNGSAFYGGIYQSNPAGVFRLEGETTGASGTFEIHYDAGVMNDLEPLRIFSDPTKVETTKIKLSSSFSHPIANLISQSL